MTNEYLVSTNEQAIIAAEAQIAANGELYISNGENWYNVLKAYNLDLWIIQKPLAIGFNQFTQEQMMAGVDMSEIDTMPFNPAWYTPIEE